MTTPAPSDPAKTPPTKQKLGLVGWSAILGFVAIVVACTFASMRAGDDPPDGFSARAACRELVADRLRSPASAEFSDLEHTGSGDRYTVTGLVDSENAFGAMIRNSFTCEVRLDGDVWRLIRMDGLTN